MTNELQNQVVHELEGKPPQAVNVITTTEEQYNMIKAANDKLEAELARQEKLRGAQLIGGRALLGEVKEKSQEEINKEKASEILKIFGYGK